MLGQKLELPNSQLQNIWVTVLLDSRTYTVFGSYEKLLDVPHPPNIPALLQAFLLLPVPQQDTPCPTQSRKHSKMPPTPRAFSPFPVDKEAKPDQRLHTEAPMEDTLRNAQNCTWS